MFGHLSRASFMAAIGYVLVLILDLFGVAYSGLVFTPVGFLVIFLLALCYSFYFRL